MQHLLFDHVASLPSHHLPAPVDNDHYHRVHAPSEPFSLAQHYGSTGYPPFGPNVELYNHEPVAGPSYVPPPFHPQQVPPGPNEDFSLGFPPGDEFQANADWDEDESRDGHDVASGNLEVKHRRRTTPEQLKVLEHWFDINPKPDNNLREWLASELGMTKRNVQVWFQNRRAKVKGQAMKEKQVAERMVTDAIALETAKTPERPTVPSPFPPGIHLRPSPPKPPGLLPPVNNVNMGRRASLASGEAAKIETWVAKRIAGGPSQARAPSFVSPLRSPLAGQAAAARRGSVPYPSTNPEGPIFRSPNVDSPKISPSVRPMPSALHLAAIRNNSRRASMPGSAQLISSGPFTPPRVVSGAYPLGGVRTQRELSPIKDHGAEVVFGDTDFATTYLTPPSSTYRLSDTSPTSYFPTDSGSTPFEYPVDPFMPNAPLPNPAFTFGQRQSNLPAEESAPFVALQSRVRLGSMASINTFTTDGTMENGSDFGQEWLGQLVPERFDPDTRRASAPAELLHNLGILGLNTNAPAQPLRPSPLGTGFSSDTFDPSVLAPAPFAFQHPAFYPDPHSIYPSDRPSTSTPEHSPLSSEGPSPLRLGIPISTSHSHSQSPTSPFSAQPTLAQPRSQSFVPSPYPFENEGKVEADFSFFADLRQGPDAVNVLV